MWPSGALVTDLSRINDFDFEDDERSAESDRLGLPWSDADYLSQIAKRLCDQASAPVEALMNEQDIYEPRPLYQRRACAFVGLS